MQFCPTHKKVVKLKRKKKRKRKSSSLRADFLAITIPSASENQKDLRNKTSPKHSQFRGISTAVSQPSADNLFYSFPSPTGKLQGWSYLKQES